jgi:DNA repair exonuclease SbcCD ATPase subunit
MSTQLKFKEIRLRNFMSFGNQETVIDLSDFGSTLIVGENVDANSNNGAGKTTIINAICYALYNKPFDVISLQKLINTTNNSKNTLMEVRLTFTKGEDEFEVYRCRGETFNINISMNGEDVTLDSVSENDKNLQELIGLSYELFTKIIIFSGNSTPFLMMPVSQQRTQVEELFNITLLTEKAIKLKEIIKTTEGSLAIQEAIIKEQEAQLALYNKQLKDAEVRVQRWEDNRLEQLVTFNDQLDLIEAVDMASEKELHALTSDLEKQLSELVHRQSNLSKDKVTLAGDVKKLSSELSHLTEDKCPYCLQQYEGAADKLVEKSEKLESKEVKLQEISKLLADVNGEIRTLSEQINEAKSVMKFSTLAAAVKAESAALAAQDKIDSLVESKNPHIEALDSLKNQAIKVVSHAEVDAIRKEIEHQQFLLKLLTDKNSFIRRKIINRTVPFLNNRLIHYTKELGLPHIVKFDDDMSCTVSEYGRELDFGNLSSGEKKRVNLSLSLAFRDVLHHLHARVNCLFIDEIDASLCTSGVENVFKLLKTKTRDEGLSLWIISHRPEAINRFDRTLTIRKEGGFSRVITNEDEMEEAA